MRAILIDPIERSITEIEHDDSLPIAAHLGCDWIDRVALTPRDDLWIDDEGRLVYPHPSGYFKIGGHIMCGRGLVLGHEDGDCKGTHLPIEVIRRAVEWIDTPPPEDVGTFEVGQ